MWYIGLVWWGFLINASLGIVVDVISFGEFTLTSDTRVDLSFFMFYSAWYYHIRAREY